MIIFRIPWALNVPISAVDSSVAFSEETVSGVLRFRPPRVCASSGLFRWPARCFMFVLLSMWCSCLICWLCLLFKTIEKRRPSFQGYFIHEGEASDGGNMDCWRKSPGGRQGVHLASLDLLSLSPRFLLFLSTAIDFFFFLMYQPIYSGIIFEHLKS